MPGETDEPVPAELSPGSKEGRLMAKEHRACQGKRAPSRCLAAAIVAAAAVAAGCAGSEVDPRCSISAEGRHRDRIAKSVNGSKLWRAYFKHVQPSRQGARLLVAFTFETERTTGRSYGGDYDPGTLTVNFNVKSLRSSSTLFEKEVSVDLGSFMIGIFDANATRAEIQEIAFRATEDKVYPFLDHWVNLAALAAMGEEESGGATFTPLLEELISDQWTSVDMRNAAKRALEQLRS